VLPLDQIRRACDQHVVAAAKDVVVAVIVVVSSSRAGHAGLAFAGAPQRESGANVRMVEQMTTRTPPRLIFCTGEERERGIRLASSLFQEMEERFQTFIESLIYLAI
jgi:hypothetical protein